ncbi:glyceraldehyde-3-phosphate dehydrogenase (NADP+) [Rhizobium leguminosarum]|uniref:Glyceraldehyde-3-phosphate dehydrogenase (NADP+) n=1 Tax=Rhizobium leguminosarum TaxID=384 RepID=A0AAE2MMH6_RHILE|nr:MULTISPECIES: aldehyde dehydrogenase family protein [Rhizobium]MBB4292383.1 glyceraldehyde-3-phosphate dehydrogenase (NADP+) [Rhizobium leguminosarum]MBB4298621.1 glyceraldehyde-3-phosphate dehydrogenase (NADP+) [Rhizobium leguminosarum]MBB4310405.1 glyceraldehyde-3-phosphate dehydrogenase (NADP+) [Rhizobium leguminosarum]MBB4434667.1 glyceraldehyde-3-phosphate dehydrogenase (NADP+) [Rhizobium esperanzae]MBB4531563.1 glyceraldehyde-3-phosphate dehydrogenase (NADP+) [Rhizobium leguminosarum]
MHNLALRQTTAAEEIVVTNPFDGTIVGTVAETDAASVNLLLERARRGAQIARSLPRHGRSTILEKAAAVIEAAREDFALLIVKEAGKTIVQARKEVTRCVNTLKLSADEAKRNAGEVIPFDSYAGSESRQGWYTREPLGVIAAITPYNDPLNLVAHKLGPAIAGGNAVILKPSELTPLSAIKLVEVLVETGLPEEIVTVAIGGSELGRALVSAKDVRMISFTGGFATGEAIAKTAGIKKLAMDLGGNAPVIVMENCNFEAAVEGCVSGAYWAAGQNCIGTQRILIQRPIYERFKTEFVTATKKLKTGNPLDADTDVGPMISDKAVGRAAAMVEQAVAAGATLICGHKPAGNLYPPTVLENVPSNCDVLTEEVFAPIVILQPFDELSDAIVLANSADYSLHAGIFTNDLEGALEAANGIDAGGVMINDSSDYRFDAMPFGGFKYGSMGREGVRFAYEDMTQPKVVCINRLKR